MIDNIDDLPQAPVRLYTVKETMRYARWSRSHIYDLIREHKIIAVKDRGRTLIDLDSVDRYRACLPRLHEPKEKSAPSETAR
jgi:excisionase family DNA binding protein